MKPMLINRDNPVPSGYNPVLIEVSDNYFLEKKTGEAMIRMINTALCCGIEICIFSAYRSSAYQQKLFDDEVKIYTEQGYSYTEALAKASEAVALPYTSEHNAGLSADLSSPELFGLTTKAFDKTRQFEWLMKNARKFGFILRYPKEKENITGIMYEPWHFRYVGNPHAEIISQNNITLEEYIQDFDKYSSG
jgi:D-alanyl-D-alanine carboxypeptidase